MPDTVIARINELAEGGPYYFIFIDRKGYIIVDSDITGVDTSGNQEQKQTQLTKDIEVNPPKYIPDVDLATNPNNKANTPEDNSNTLEPPQLLKIMRTKGDINQNISPEPVQSSRTTNNISEPKHDIPGVHRDTRTRN